MDVAWERFFDEQKSKAQKEQLIKRKIESLRKGKTIEITAANVPINFNAPQESILKLRQFDSITVRHKNSMMDAYYKLR